MKVLRLNPEHAVKAAKVCHLFKQDDESKERLMEFLENPSSHIFLAEERENIMGFLLAYELPRIDRHRKMMFLYEIEVLEKYRNHGIGTLLVENLADYCERNNFTKMFVLTDTDNNNAMKLYTGAGGREIYRNGVLYEWHFN